MERKNLWAPWRIKYIQGLSGKNSCFLCDDIASPEEDAENFVLWRTPDAIVVMNRFPYNNGHLLARPVRLFAELYLSIAGRTG
jgi:ATP adenylyltransferase